MNFQVETIDDVFRNWHYLVEHDVEIEMGPGRHPQSGAIFLYFLGPEGFTYEYSFGVRRIDALGQRFDPSLHEAVSMQESADHPPGTVSGVIEDGYTINGRLLRPARVVVAKASPSIAPELHGESQVNERQA